jgi:hypothetical protein
VRPIRFCRAMLSVLLLLSPLAAAGQLPRPPGVEERPHPSEQEQRALREQAKRMNRERQEALVRDTDQLLKLATELKEYVDKSNENVLSMDVVRKAAEIEKLAHSVKTKMKGN